MAIDRSAQPDFFVTTARSLIGRTVSPDEVRKLGAVLKRDEDFPLDELIKRLSAVGYVREDPVNGVGQFSIRGGIVDIWPPDAINPLRIEFFGDTVDSIREFDAETQLSTGQLKEISIAPMREFAASAADLKDWAFFARERWPGENLARNLKDRTDFADEGESFSGWEFLLPLVKPLSSSVFDYLDDTIFVIDEPTTVENVVGKFYDDVDRHFCLARGSRRRRIASRRIVFRRGRSPRKAGHASAGRTAGVGQDRCRNGRAVSARR